jgi:hypothetical protein
VPPVHLSYHGEEQVPNYVLFGLSAIYDRRKVGDRSGANGFKHARA